jgi:hypothetical protein
MRYKKIFSVSILHDFYPDGNGGLYRFVPTPACVGLLKDLGAFYKVHRNMLYVVTKIDDFGKPLIPIPENTSFDFFAAPLDGDFFLFTSATIQTSKAHYWIKDNPFPSNTPQYLFPDPIAYSSLKDYHKGAVVLNEGLSAYKALAEVPKGSDLNNHLLWQSLGQTASARFSTRLFFQNANPLVVENMHYLHPMANAYDAGMAYQVGSMVTGPANAVFEALKNLSSGSNLNDGTAWVNRGQHPFVTNQSLVQMHGSMANLPVAPQSKTVQVNIYKAFPDNIKPAAHMRSETVVYKDEVSAHPVDFSKLPPGLYEVLINNCKHFIYIDGGMHWQNYPMLISIGHYGSISPSVSLCDGNGALRSPEYAIRFAPKSVMWQLRFRGASLPSSVENDGPASDLRFVKPGASPNIFLSEHPVRLQRNAYKNGVLLLNNNDPPDTLKINQLPAPGLMASEIIRQHDTDYFLTTTNLYS